LFWQLESTKNNAVIMCKGCLVRIGHNEEGIKEVKKEGFRSTTVRLPALFVRSSTLCLPVKALLFFISFNLSVMRLCYCTIKLFSSLNVFINPVIIPHKANVINNMLPHRTLMTIMIESRA